MEQDRALYRRLLDTPYAHLLIDALLQGLTERIRLDTPESHPHEANIIVGAMCGHIIQWIRHDLPYSPEVYARMVYWTTTIGLMTLRGEGDALTLPSPETLATTPFGTSYP
ncbi:MAG: hypothetical protein AAF125_06425 [Chloroflexota bacterium]